MDLNTIGMGRGRGNVVNFRPMGPGGVRMMNHEQMFRPNAPGTFRPSYGYYPTAQFGTPCISGGPYGFKAAPVRPSRGKFPRRNFKNNLARKTNSVHVPEIDFTKPWVTDEIINEETKKQQLWKTWNESNEIEDWRKYKGQKQIVQELYDKAKANFAAGLPQETPSKETFLTIKSLHYCCEACDKSFTTDDDLFVHKAEHQTCGREGCQFTAHPKIIEKHIKMQHVTGLYKRIGKLYTEEDIAKWIEERKKRYPTRKVIEEKKILEEQKHSRGERIKNNDSKFNKSFNNKNKRTGKRHFEKKAQRSSKTLKVRKNKKPVELKCCEEDISDVRKGVPAFPGIKSTNEPEVPEKNDFDISDEDWEGDCSPPKAAKPVLNSSLQLLAALYDSDAENQNEESNKNKIMEKITQDEDSGPEEVKTVSSKNPFSQENENEERDSFKPKIRNKKIVQNGKRKSYINDSHIEKRGLTLLEKLLKDEIRHERNVILQCVHYVVKNNFFKQ